MITAFGPGTKSPGVHPQLAVLQGIICVEEGLEELPPRALAEEAWLRQLSPCSFRAGLQGMKLDLTLKEEPRDHGCFAYWICPFGTRTNRYLSFSVIQGFIRREVTSGLTRLSLLPYKCIQPDSFSTPPTSQREMLENEPRISQSSQENHRRCCCDLESLCH